MGVALHWGWVGIRILGWILFALAVCRWLASWIVRRVRRWRYGPPATAGDTAPTRRPLDLTGDPALIERIEASDVPLPLHRLAIARIERRDGTWDIRTAFHDCDDADLFEVGSISKALTGLLIADAIDRGELGLDDPLESSLPELTGRPIGRRTLAELVTHTVGLPRNGGGIRVFVPALVGVFLATNVDAGISRRMILRWSRRAHLRDGYRYSNLGGGLGGLVVAAAAGRAYPDLVAERLVGPLGLQDTVVPTSVAVQPKGWTDLGTRSQPWVSEGFAPAGGVVSSLRDMVVVARRILDGTCVGQSATHHVAGQHGIFWVVDERRRRVWHNGETGGYHAMLALAPEDGAGVVVLGDTAVDYDGLAFELLRDSAADVGRAVR
jgi:CubicO group peptidase (beta-lactamase class C family)